MKGRRALLALVLLVLSFWLGRASVAPVSGQAASSQELSLFPFDLKFLVLMRQARALLDQYYVESLDSEAADRMAYGAIKGMVSAVGDPYTRFVEPRELEDERMEMSGEYGGVGMYIGQRDGRILVIAPIEDTPAERAGIKAGDEIVKVDEKSVVGMTQDKVVRMLRGTPGTRVTVWIRREGKEDLLKFDIVRELIKIKVAKGEVLEQKGLRIGYLRLSYFNQKAADELAEVIRKVSEDRVDGYILDLRNNPGGLLDVGIDVASLFMERGVVVEVRGRSGRAEGVYSTTREQLVKGPLAVLVNEGSASASEIVTGALRDSGRAVVFGKKTFGKGLVQSLFALPDGSGVFITVARYYTPRGDMIDKKGISPDVEVEGEYSREREKDVQLKRALELFAERIEGERRALVHR